MKNLSKYARYRIIQLFRSGKSKSEIVAITGFTIDNINKALHGIK